MNAFQNGNATNGGQQPRPSYSNAVRRTPGTGGNKVRLSHPVVSCMYLLIPSFRLLFVAICDDGAFMGDVYSQLSLV